MVRRAIQDTGCGEAQVFCRSTLTFVQVALVAASLIGTAAALPSLAQDARSQAREACGADYRRLCAGVMPGGGRIRKCLDDRADALSSRCKQIISAQGGK